MLKKIIIALVVIIAVFSIIVSFQPSEFHVSRTATITAPADKIFEQVNDLHKWETWSPWAKLDPNAKSSFEGPLSGVGAIMHWDGNNNVGVGSMTIIESHQNEFIKFKLDFLKPMKNTNNAEFTFKQDGNNTNVTWVMYGENNFIGKTMSLVFNCEKMVGGQFEKGLANLKSIIETAPK